MQSCKYRSDMILKINWSVRGWCLYLIMRWMCPAVGWCLLIHRHYRTENYLAFPGGGSSSEAAARPHSGTSA